MTNDKLYRPGCSYVVSPATDARCERLYASHLWLVYYRVGTAHLMADEPIVRCGAHLAATVGALAANDRDVGYLDRVEPAGRGGPTVWPDESST